MIASLLSCFRAVDTDSMRHNFCVMWTKLNPPAIYLLDTKPII